jgi:hypothetical protein
MSSKPRNHEVSDPYYATYPPPTHEASVILILDSNVFVSHIFGIGQLKSVSDLNDLFAHLRVIIPEVVLRECERLYSEKTKLPKGMRPPELKERMAQLDHAASQLLQEHFDRWRIELEKIAEIVPTSQGLLRGAYDRLMAKKPPCHERDETRDAIIWETILATQFPSRQSTIKIFVTSNTKDFPFESHPGLQEEMRNEGILIFKKFSDFQNWVESLRPTLWRAGLAFATWYEEQDFSWQTGGRLQDELPEHLLMHCEHFGYDSEIIDLDRTRWEIAAERPDNNGPSEFDINEEWQFNVSYAVYAEVRIGGKDGIEVDVSDWLNASGTATLTRTLKFDSNRSLVANEVEVTRIELMEDEDEWDPHEAWIDSLAENRDDA